MLVVVARVLGMAVAVMDIVDMVAVLHGFMPAVISAVAVFLCGVLGRVLVFVVVILVFGMAVPLVKIVDVIPVLDGFVGAVIPAVGVLGEGVFCLDFLGHDNSFAEAASPPGCRGGAVPGCGRWCWGDKVRSARNSGH